MTDTIRVLHDAEIIEATWRAVGVSPPSCTHLTRRAEAAPLALQHLKPRQAYYEATIHHMKITGRRTLDGCTELVGCRSETNPPTGSLLKTRS